MDTQVSSSRPAKMPRIEKVVEEKALPSISNAGKTQPSASASATPGPARTHSNKEKFHAMKARFDEVNEVQKGHKKDLDIANAKMKMLQAEIDLLLEAMLDAASQDRILFKTAPPHPSASLGPAPPIPGPGSGLNQGAPLSVPPPSSVNPGVPPPHPYSAHGPPYPPATHGQHHPSQEHANNVNNHAHGHHVHHNQTHIHPLQHPNAQPPPHSYGHSYGNYPPNHGLPIDRERYEYEYDRERERDRDRERERERDWERERERDHERGRERESVPVAVPVPATAPIQIIQHQPPPQTRQVHPSEQGYPVYRERELEREREQRAYERESIRDRERDREREAHVPSRSSMSSSSSTPTHTNGTVITNGLPMHTDAPRNANGRRYSSSDNQMEFVQEYSHPLAGPGQSPPGPGPAQGGPNDVHRNGRIRDS